MYFLSFPRLFLNSSLSCLFDRYKQALMTEEKWQQRMKDVLFAIPKWPQYSRDLLVIKSQLNIKDVTDVVGVNKNFLLTFFWRGLSILHCVKIVGLIATPSTKYFFLQYSRTYSDKFDWGFAESSFSMRGVGSDEEFFGSNLEFTMILLKYMRARLI